MTKDECIAIYMEMVNIGAKVMEIENGLSKVLGVDSCEKFGEIFDQLAFSTLGAVATFKSDGNFSACDYENFINTRMDQHMTDFMELVTERSLRDSVPNDYEWVVENISTLIED